MEIRNNNKISYERRMLEELEMPSRESVENALLVSLFKHNGCIKEFSEGEEIVEELAENFKLSHKQRNAKLETIYRKENRLKRSSLWHRLLFRAADTLAKNKLIARPSKTLKLTNRKEWMLLESGYDKALQLQKLSFNQKEILRIKSYEVQKVVKELLEKPKPTNYNPLDNNKKELLVTKKSSIRARGFRQAIIEIYEFKCAVCGMKLYSPDRKYWEVEAAHIVPHSAKGKDDIWNGIAMCKLHHWAFDVGWFTLSDDYKIIVSNKLYDLPSEYGMIYNYNFLSNLKNEALKIILPNTENIYPHVKSIQWHRNNIFYK